MGDIETPARFFFTKYVAKFLLQKYISSPHRAPAEVQLADVVRKGVNHAASHDLHHLRIPLLFGVEKAWTQVRNLNHFSENLLP